VANANTVRRQVSGSQQLTIAPQVGLLSTHVVFQLNNNGLTLTGGGLIPLSAGTYGLYLGTGQVLKVVANGTLTGIVGATDTFAVKLFVVTAAGLAVPPTNATIIAASGGSSLVADSGTIATVAGTSASFTFQARLQLSATGILTGEFTVTVGGVDKVYATTAAVSGLGEADLNFFFSLADPNGANASATATLDEFRIDWE